MALLDELKEKADRLKLARESEQARQARLEAVYQGVVKPAMGRLSAICSR